MNYNYCKQIKKTDLRYNDNRAISHCQEIIDALIAQGKIFYIGGTNDPDRRRREHLRNKGLWRMYPLVRTYKTLAKKIEDNLISIYKNNPNNYHMIKDNSPQFGGVRGLLNGINYVYIITN